MAQKIEIDSSRCTGCGLCTIVCPMRIFSLKGTEVPTLGPTADGCIDCGHCAAVCPAGAVSVGEMTAESLEKANPKKLPTFEQFAHLAAVRRSIRSFQTEPVAQNLLDRLFEIVRMAPTAKNLLPLKWTVVNNREKTKELARIIIEGLRAKEEAAVIVEAWDKGYDWILRGAPCLVYAQTDGSAWTAYDSTIAAEMIDLAAPLLGLGACWAGFFIHAVENNPVLREKIGMTGDEKIGAALMLGKPAREFYSRIPARPMPNVRYIS